MVEFIYFTGLAVWIALVVVAVLLVLSVMLYLVKEHILPSVSNLAFSLFGSKKLSGRYYDIWQKYYAHKLGVREHWKEWRHLKRLAYTKILREARKEMYNKINRG